MLAMQWNIIEALNMQSRMSRRLSQKGLQHSAAGSHRMKILGADRSQIGVPLHELEHGDYCDYEDRDALQAPQQRVGIIRNGASPHLL